MTDSSTNPPEENKPLFENDFAIVTANGEVKLKKTEYFDEKVLTTVDPDSVEDQVTAFKKAFASLEEKVSAFMDDAEDRISEGSDSLEASFKELIDDVKESDAIGDFESLLNNAKKRFEELKESAEAAAYADKETEEAASGDDETEEAVAEESGVESDENDVTAEPAAEKGEEEEEKEESPEEYFKELAGKAEQIAGQSDWAYVSMEFDNIDLQWEEGPDPEGADIKPYRQKIDDLRKAFEEKKQAHYEEQKRVRLENLEKKKDLLRQLKEIIDNKKWTQTREVGKIKGRWDHIRPVPAEEAEKLQTQFDSLLATFDEHKVDRLVKQKQQEEDNLTGKLVILEKMERFVKDLGKQSGWDDLEKEFENLGKQFRKIGRIPSEKNQEVWGRYHQAQDTFHSMRFKHDAKYRDQIEKFLSKKKKLIDEAEALLDSDDLPEAARKVNKLHRRWKKVGNLPQKDENEMWDRFKEATDKFNQLKSDNIDLLRKQEDENYQEKLGLIDEANNLKDSEEWDKTHQQFQKLMKKWKEVGPVPKRKSGKIWKKFKGAMDHFYDRRRDHFKDVKEERKDNLKEKEEILEKLAELKSHEDPIKAVELAKPLQEEFKKAGYVPIKHKNRMWKEYRETCDVIYDRLRAAKAAVEVVGRENVDDFSADDIAEIRKKQKDATRLRKEVTKLNSELIQMKESLSYFKPSGKGSSLLDDVKEQIAKAEQELEDKEKKLDGIEREIDQIKKEA